MVKRYWVQLSRASVACWGVNMSDPTLARYIAVHSVLDERERQDDKWGVQNHDPVWWLAILTEEVGEVAQAALKLRFGGDFEERLRHLREECVQVAAVATAMVECIDRGDWLWSK